MPAFSSVASTIPINLADEVPSQAVILKEQVLNRLTENNTSRIDVDDLAREFVRTQTEVVEAARLPVVQNVAGTHGSSTTIPVVGVDTHGRVVSASSVELARRIRAPPTQGKMFSYTGFLDVGGIYATVGYSGGFSDGMHVYMAPAPGNEEFHVIRVPVDPPSNFTQATLDSVDLISTTTQGFEGMLTDGRYAYLIPAEDGLLVRIDLVNFGSGGVTVVNVATGNAAAVKFSGGFIQGPYLYLVPRLTNSTVVRIPLVNFTANACTYLNIASADALAVGFSGGFTDGTYGYLVPSSSAVQHGRFVRFGLADFSINSVDTLVLTNKNASAKGFSGGFYDGRFAYLVPTNGLVARVDLNAWTLAATTLLDLTAANASLVKFRGGFTDGQYAYFAPHADASDTLHGLFTRVDLDNFATAGVRTVNVAAELASVKGFFGACTDGRFAYLIPNPNATTCYLARVNIGSLFPAGF